MEILTGILIAIIFIVLFIYSRIFTTLIHELGHALPSLLYTDGPVKIYVGAYGDEKNSFKISLGRLHTFFKLDLFHWNLGLCQHQPVRSFTQQIVIVLGGPIFSLLVGVVCLFLMYIKDWNDYILFVFGMFIISAVYDFLVNIIPSSHPIMMHDGSMTYNDGNQLVQLIRESKLPPKYFTAEKLFAEKKFEAAASAYQQVLQEGFDQKEIHFAYVQSLVEAKETDEALNHLLLLEKNKKLQVADYNYLANLFLVKENFTNAISCFNKYLFKYFKNPVALNSRGYAHLRSGDYEKAYYDINSALVIRPKFAEALVNFGLVKIRLGEEEEGLKDLKAAKKLDDKNPFLYLHFGYYFQEINQSDLAFENFQKAKDLNIQFDGIDYLLEMTRKRDF